MNEQKESRELMKEVGVEHVQVLAPQQGRVDLAQVTKDMEQRVALVERIHTIIQKSIVPETDIKRMGDKFRRTINFARKCFRIVGGSIEYTTYPSGLKYLRESMEDDKGAWYAISVACTYSTPWGERVEAFKRITSREPFFGITDGEFENAAEVNESDILEMAVTEAFKSAVFTALGLPKDISPDELKKFGVKGEKAEGHSFDGAKGAQGGNQSQSQEEYDARKQIEKLCKQLLAQGFEHDGEKASTPEDVLRMVTANPSKGWGGWKSFKPIKENQLGRIKDALEKIVGEMGSQDNEAAPANEAEAF